MTTTYQNADTTVRLRLGLIQYFDVVFVVIGGAIALALGAPATGVLIGAAGWIVQRVIQVVDRRFTRKIREPRTQVGIHVSESFGRIWLLAAAIVVAGIVGGRSSGLAAAVTVFSAYSVGFAIRMANGQPGPREME